jgi:two-component system OmpR family response regulator/two-component system response regulator ChvI
VRVLVIDDDRELLESLVVVLGAQEHAVVTASGGRAGLALAETERFDAIVCDINMPDLDGFTLCRKLRASGNRTPLVLLTSRDGEIDEALGLDLGADDYMTKPFSTRVLLARLGALVRRSGTPAVDDIVRAGELEIDRERLAIRFKGTAIEATLTELRLLAALAERPGRVLGREALLERAREDDSHVALRIVDTYVARLRKKLDAVEPGAGAAIETVTGAGYRWRA